MGMLDFFRSRIKLTSPTQTTTLENKGQPSSAQRQKTQEIIRSTSFETAQSIEELDGLAHKRSDMLHQERQQRILAFNPYDVEVVDKEILLTSLEKSFLQYMAGRDVSDPQIPAYWAYEYSLDFGQIMSKLLGNGFIYVANPDISNLKVTELKELLGAFGYSKDGKKADLVNRVISAIPPEELNKRLEKCPRKYALTPKGEDTIRGLQPSATKDSDFEDLCLERIYAQQFKEAYELVCKNELNKIIPRGIIDWNRELARGLDPFTERLYKDYWQSDITPHLPQYLAKYELQLKASAILGLMLGIAADKTTILFIRISQISIKDTQQKAKIVSSIQALSFKLMDAIQQHSIDSLSQ